MMNLPIHNTLQRYNFFMNGVTFFSKKMNFFHKLLKIMVLLKSKKKYYIQ